MASLGCCFRQRASTPHGPSDSRAFRLAVGPSPSRAKAERPRQPVPPSGLTRAGGVGWRQARMLLPSRSVGPVRHAASPLCPARFHSSSERPFRGVPPPPGSGTPASHSGCASARLSLPGETAGPAGAHATAPLLRTPAARPPAQAGPAPGRLPRDQRGARRLPAGEMGTRLPPRRQVRLPG